MYRTYVINKIENDAMFREKLLRLKGKNLGCWCYPEVCHGNVLLELIERYS